MSHANKWQSFKLGLILIPAFLIIGCSKPITQSKVEFMVPVTVAKVDTATFEDKVVTTGTLRAREIVNLTAGSNGLLQVLPNNSERFSVGDKVTPGQQIAVITGEDARIAASIISTQTQLNTTRNNLEGATALYNTSGLSEADYGQRKVEYEEAKLAYDRAILTQERNRIITPIEGVIIQLANDNNGQLLANGQLVEPGQLIAQVAPMDTLIADVDLVGEDIANVEIGFVARAKYHAWQDKQFEGSLKRIAPVVDKRTRALNAELEINNPNGLLKPGMFVEVSIIKEVKADVPRVPRRALTSRGGKRVLFVVDGQRAKQREVETGLEDDNWIEIRKGITPGESIIVSGLETLTDQMPIRITRS